jgi:hypothetical protein
MSVAHNMTLNENVPSIINKAADSKVDFMKFINWCGYSRNSMEYKRINFLVRDESEVIEWFYCYNGDIDTLTETTDKYREYKLKKYEMDLHEFLARCAISLKDAMERLFMQECPSWQIGKLSERIHSNNLTLEKVYQIFKSDSWYNSLSKIVRSDI